MTLYTAAKRFASATFVPKHSPPAEDDVRRLRDFLRDARRLLIVTGAGISTESGIPDYRSEDVGLYARTGHRPVQHQEFVKSAATRRRYWARNYAGWERFSGRRPNATHYVVRDLETVAGKASMVVTQNVDGLHRKAGSLNVVELHGSAYRVVCLGCGAPYDRVELQGMLAKLNPGMGAKAREIRPDGDVEIADGEAETFNAPHCERCGGALKPDIVFFGDNVPRRRVDLVKANVSASDSLLVLGSSLSVFSGYRIVLQAVEEGKPVAVVNIGPTRADGVVDLKVSAKCGEVLPMACR